MTVHSEHELSVNHYALGAGLAGITILLGVLLPRNVSLNALALLLFGIAAIYFGFAVADGRTSALLIEGSVVLLYLALALAGLVVSVWILVVGYLLHGTWDLLHRNRRFGANVARWYVPFCLVYDWVIAGFIIVWSRN